MWLPHACTSVHDPREQLWLQRGPSQGTISCDVSRCCLALQDSVPCWQHLAPTREHTWGKDSPHPYLMLHHSREVHQNTPREDREAQNHSSCSSSLPLLENHFLCKAGPSQRESIANVFAKPLSQHPEPCRDLAPASAPGHTVSDESSEQMCSWPPKRLYLSNLGHVAQAQLAFKTGKQHRKGANCPPALRFARLRPALLVPRNDAQKTHG